MSSTITGRLLLQRLRLRQVALLLALREHRSLREAAETLGVTQPAATSMLKELESSLDLVLFDRSGRRLVPTEIGAALIAHCVGLEGTLQSVARDLEGLRQGGGGALAIGCIPASSPTLLARTVAQMKRADPTLGIRIVSETSDQLLDLLDQGELDVVIGRVTEGHAHSNYRVRTLDAEPLSIIGSPDRPADPRRLKLADLVDEPWVLQPRQSPAREIMEHEFRLNGLDRPRNLVETSSILTTLSLLGEAPMVAVIPTNLALPYRDRGLVSVLPLRIKNSLESFRSIVPKDRTVKPQTARFLDLLHAAPKRGRA